VPFRSLLLSRGAAWTIAAATLASVAMKRTPEVPLTENVKMTSEVLAVPTFAVDVAPIVYSNCVVCHRPGQSAPFALLTYDDVRKHGETIVDVTASRYMPPWHASRAEGFPLFRDERRLSDSDLRTLKAWVAAGMPAGDMKKAPLPPTFPSGWALGVPDLVVKMSRTIDVPADGPDLYKNVTMPIDLPDDRWITAVDFEPSARSVVHHALFFSGPASAVIGDDELLPGLSAGLRGGGRAVGAADQAWGGLGGWVPGQTPRFYPDGIAQPLPKHTNLVVQLHLHPSGKAEREQGVLAIYFSKTPPKKSLTGIQVPPMFGFAAGIDIPSGEKAFTIHDSFTLPVDVEAFGARGHAHYLARDMKLTATLPDGTSKGILWIKDWDFGWQDSYFFKDAFALPKGTRIDATIVYDNSTGNPRNPHTPPVHVTWGRSSFDEMGSLTLLVASPQGPDAEVLRTAVTQHFRQQLLQRFRR
jgi:mono/diheme cytochrome c family protein